MKEFFEKGYEKVERYCHIINRNTSVVRRITGKDRTFTCSNYEECEKNGGCKNCMCKKFNSEKG
jgi:hypothetical protein